MKQKIIILFSLSVLASGLVIGLFYNSKRINIRPNGFKRLFYEKDPESLHILRSASPYIAGCTDSTLYFADENIPEQIKETNNTFSRISTVNIFNNNVSKLLKTKITIDSPYIFIYDESARIVYITAFKTSNFKKAYPVFDSFGRPLFLNKSAVVIKIDDTSDKKFVLARQSLLSGKRIISANLLNKQIEGYFSTDGMLRYDRELKKMVYISFYNNQFFCTDSNLDLLYRGHTIDTCSHVNIQVSEKKETGISVLSGPPLFVNKRCAVSGHYIYVGSNLLADNESRQRFNNNSVIDVYNIDSGKYLLSFYIPAWNGIKLNDLYIHKNTLYAVYDKAIISYSLNVLHL